MEAMTLSGDPIIVGFPTSKTSTTYLSQYIITLTSRCLCVQYQETPIITN